MGMDTVFLAARCFLALVFALAAAGKLTSRGEVREALGEFGLPRRLTAAGAFVLPLAELAVTVLLIPRATARAAAFAALGLLMVFCIAIGRALARGEQPNCNCFGQIRSTPVGRATLARNVALAGVAGVVAAAGPGAGLDNTRIALTLGLLAVATAAVLSRSVFRHLGHPIERSNTHEDRWEPAGLPVGEPAPAFEVDDLHGQRRTLDEMLVRGLPLALVFSDPGCAACVTLAPGLRRLGNEKVASLTVALITRAGAAENRALLDGLRLDRVLVQQAGELSEAYRIDSVPSATIVDPDGRIASPTVSGVPAVEELLAAAAASAGLRLAQR
jgi:hypothetical protein